MIKVNTGALDSGMYGKSWERQMLLQNGLLFSCLILISIVVYSGYFILKYKFPFKFLIYKKEAFEMLKYTVRNRHFYG